jgi:hypothetical protein
MLLLLSSSSSSLLLLLGDHGGQVSFEIILSPNTSHSIIMEAQVMCSSTLLSEVPVESLNHFTIMFRVDSVIEKYKADYLIL